VAQLSKQPTVPCRSTLADQPIHVSVLINT